MKQLSFLVSGLKCPGLCKVVPEHPHPPPSLRAEDEKSKHFGVNVLYILERKRPVKRYISRKHTQIFKPENKQCLHSLFTLAPAGFLRVTRLTLFQLFLAKKQRFCIYSYNSEEAQVMLRMFPYIVSSRLVMNTTCKCVTTSELKIHLVLLSGHRSGRVSPNKKTERLIMLKLITFSWEEAAQ